MADTDWKKLRGFKQLLHAGVREGASFVEKHHRHAANKPFDILEAVPPLAGTTRIVRVVHDGVLSVVYGSIRAVNDVTEHIDDWVLDQLDDSRLPPAAAEAALGSPPSSQPPDDPSGE